MPRPLRPQIAGAVYHLMARGVRGAPLYTDTTERMRFLEILDKACERYDWQALGYCLMGNHYHLVVRTNEPTLSRGMQWLNSCYARWFGDRHGYQGHVLFRRFHAVLVESDRQLADTMRYVLRNPVAAGLCVQPQDWRWSSYAATLGREPPPRYLAVDWLADQFGDDIRHARANFVAFMRDGRNDLA